MNQSQSARNALFAWEVREQLYALKIYVEEPTGWEVRGILPGTGPFISKDRIVLLDVSRVQGDQLRIRIHPPAGFWALNSFRRGLHSRPPRQRAKVEASDGAGPAGKRCAARVGRERRPLPGDA